MIRSLLLAIHEAAVRSDQVVVIARSHEACARVGIDAATIREASARGRLHREMDKTLNLDRLVEMQEAGQL